MAAPATSEQKTLFVRMIENGKDPQLCLKFMALWMWLQTTIEGFEELVQKISSHSDDFLASVAEEAEAILASLNLCSSERSKDFSANLGLKTTLSLAQRAVLIVTIIGDKDKICRGIVRVYNEVCSVVFKDVLEERKIKVCLIEEEKKEKSVGSKLNPCAKTWTFATDRAPEEDRCLYLTFSNGYPLTENQIFRFFTREFGKCVERVYVHWPTVAMRKSSRRGETVTIAAEDVSTLFGKVVFNNSSIPAAILSGDGKFKSWKEEKPVWCKKYEHNRKPTLSFSD